MECRTTSPNAYYSLCPARTINRETQQTLDLSVLSHLKPSNRPLFPGQLMFLTHQSLIVCPVRTRVDSDTESEGGIQPPTPPRNEARTVNRVREDSDSSNGSGMDLADSPEAPRQVKTQEKRTAKRLAKRSCIRLDLSDVGDSRGVQESIFFPTIHFGL